MLMKLNNSLGSPVRRLLKPVLPNSYNRILSRAEERRKSQQIMLGTEIFHRPQILIAARELFVVSKDKRAISLSTLLVNNARKLIGENQPVIVTNLEIDDEFKSLIEGHKMILSTEELEREILAGGVQNRVYVPLFEVDDEALPFLEILYKHHALVVPPVLGSKTSYRFTNRQALSALDLTWSQIDRISHWDVITHENLTEALAMTNQVLGDIVEIGVYKGGTALTILNFLQLNQQNAKSKKRRCYFFDTFDGFSESEVKNPDQIWRGTHKLFGADSTIDYVNETLEKSQFSFNLLKKDITTDELPDEINQISFAHIDVDSYLATSAALNKIGPKISKGGIILLEDPPGTPLLYGALFALKEFLKTPIGLSFITVFKQSHYMLIKTND